MKKIAFYLPQFHEIPENNDAWGNGFTEWTNVKKAVPRFEGHYQPRIPMNNNYYNLLETDTLKWQAGLADRFGIDGLCFYHYWFNGRLVLEKPVDILHENKEINISYCFAWANEPWTKTWHGASGNKEILIPQTYGGKEEWEKHFNYFIKYFKDERYIKFNGAPVLLIYRLQNIIKYNDCIRYWKRRAVEEGFPGIHIVVMKIGLSHVYMSKWVDATVDFEPNNTKYFLKAEEMDYREINEAMITIPHKPDEYRTAFVDYDDTPRRGSRGIVTKNASPELFAKYFKKIYQLAKEEKSPFLFINAWNEWGEGNYLEPDEKNKYLYLKAVADACEVKENGIHNIRI